MHPTIPNSLTNHLPLIHHTHNSKKTGAYKNDEIVWLDGHHIDITAAGNILEFSDNFL